MSFGPFELDLDGCELYRDGRPLGLQAQPTRLLALLVSEAGRLVSRERIRAALWRPGTHVDADQGINHCIRQLRNALGDDAEEPTFIATVRRRGYRFVAEVEGLEAEVPAASPAGRGPGALRWKLGLGAGVAAVALVTALHDRGRELLSSRSPRTPTIAVLPFQNLTGDPEEDYLSDALTEELITQLGRRYAARLGVIARTSAMRYKETTKGIAEIGGELGASFLVEGAVRRSGERVRITAQLIRVDDASHL